MSVELRWGIVKKLKRYVLSNVIYSLEKIGVLNRLGEDVTAILPSLVRVHGITQDFKTEFLNLTSAGFVPEIYIGHFSHFDHPALSHGCNELLNLAREGGFKDKLKSFATTLATSVPGGQQSPFLRAIYPKMEAYARERGLEFVPITRDKDVKQFGMSVGSTSEKRPLVSRMEERGIGIVIPTGGSVQPGRHVKGGRKGEIYGLQEIVDKNLINTFRLMELHGRSINQQPYFLPMGICGTWRFFSSDSLLPTPEALATLYYSENTTRFKERFIDFLRINHKLRIDITFGTPLTAEDMNKNIGAKWRKDTSGVNQFLMAQVAALLPEDARGFYGKYIKKDPSST